MKLAIFLYICAMVVVTLYWSVEAKKKTDNCLPKNTANKMDVRKMIPTTMPQIKSHGIQKPLKSSLAEEYDDEEDLMAENSMDGGFL